MAILQLSIFLLLAQEQQVDQGFKSVKTLTVLIHRLVGAQVREREREREIRAAMSELRRRERRPPADKLREIEVLIISAQNLKNVKHVTKMKPYAEVYVEKDHVARTQVDELGGTNPTWNEVVKVNFREGLPERDIMAALNVDIYAHGHVREKPVGSARVLLCDVLKGGDAAEPVENPIQCMTVQVWRDSGRPQGLLNLWVPPTGKFLIRRESLSFSIKEAPEEGELTVRGGD